MRKPRVLFLGRLYAGHRTRFLNLQAHTQGDARIKPVYRQVTGWQEGGLIESVSVLPASLRGRLRAVVQSAPLAAFPRPDVIWTGVSEVALPFLWAQAGPLQRPMILDLDSTLDQLEVWAEDYFHRPGKQGLRLQLARAMERLLWRKVSVFTPWSQWAANALRRAGVSEESIEVCPPGVDLEAWQPNPQLRGPGSERLRLLFVGADFERKGGKLLLDVFSERFSKDCELHIVTRDEVETRPHVYVHRAEPNTPVLKDLFAQADLFVLPTRAECFGIAAVEAMASGLPVVMGNVGGAEDIVTQGETGWLIEPNREGLVGALTQATSNRAMLKGMGLNARAAAEAKFDGQRNDQHILDVILELGARSRMERR
ncbi:MAG TPA: glycosyltransferase family 4 protein [Dehalococcoidia bacterium]|nr:glycosyltransferase family 4 protein [Dehalococcoidia bacterium]